MQLTSLGLVRGVIGYFAGLVIGMVTVVIFRLVLGMSAWDEEAVWVGGIIFALIGFVLAIGATSDWLKWTRGIDTPMHHGPPADKPAWTRYFAVDYNHKVIGIQYGVTGLLLLVIGGSLALVFRTELADSGISFLQAGTYNTFLSMHGWVALAAILLGVGGMANYL
ncbi:MAG: cytochrome C oxidase subunit I, partial [Caldilinea sp.]